MENFVNQTITRAEKHKNEVVTNLGIDDIRNAFDSKNKRSWPAKNCILFTDFRTQKVLLWDYLEVLLLLL